MSISKKQRAVWDNKFLITNLSNSSQIFVTPLGYELENESFRKFYKSKKKYTKKLSFLIKRTLPVIKTLEGLVYIPHLNIYNNVKVIGLVRLDTIDFDNSYN